MSKIKLALLDDETIFRTSLKLLLQSRNKNFEFIFEGSNGGELIEYLKKSDSIIPDILLLDIRMPDGMNGMETISFLSKKYENIKVIVLSSITASHCKTYMISKGVCGYLAKNASPNCLLTTIEKVYEDGIYFESDMIKYIMDKSKILNSRTVKHHHELSDREVDVLKLLTKQLSNKQIGEQLNISERTVEGHRKNMMTKTRSDNVIGLILFAIREQIIDIELLEP